MQYFHEKRFLRVAKPQKADYINEMPGIDGSR